jgi:two-component system, sensor histidine kinase and response regulator
MNSRKPTVLIVDDEPANIEILSETLGSKYEILVAVNGGDALDLVAEQRPNLILLDVVMPEMNGYEVCDRLKADEALKDIPVIFISALNETLDKVRAFSVGGVDYITKPFEFEEVEARVRTHLEMQRQKKALRENYEKLCNLETLRDNLVHMIVHDLRSPLTGVRNVLQILQRDLDKKLTLEQKELLQSVLDSNTLLIERVASLLDISRLEAGQMPLKPESCDLHEVVNTAIQSLGGLASEHQLIYERVDTPILAFCDRDVTSRIIANLVANAIKFTPLEGTIRVALHKRDGQIQVMVSDTGYGIPVECREKIFEKFGQVETRGVNTKYSSGLGLTFCKLAVEAQGGCIGLESEVGKGSSFWFLLPTRDGNEPNLSKPRPD